MPFADSSETRIAFVEEAVLGTIPDLPAFQQVRVTSESFELAVQNVISDEIRPDATVADLMRVAASVSGELELELSFGTSDTDRLLEQALRGTFVNDELKAGTERRSLTLEKRFAGGAAGHFFRYRGCRVGRLALTIEHGQSVRARFGFTGLDQISAESEAAGASYLPPNANPMMTAAATAGIAVGGLAGALACTRLSLEINNNLRPQNAVGSLTAAGIGYGRREITGGLTAYFENGALYDHFANGLAASLSFTTSDGLRRYTWSLPYIKFTTGRVVAEGTNRDVLVDMQFQALASGADASDLCVSRAGI